MGWLEKVRADHVTFGVVLGEDKKKFKTRSGDTVRLVDLLDEGVKRAQEKLEAKAKEREEHFTNDEIQNTSKALAYGCIKVRSSRVCPFCNVGSDLPSFILPRNSPS